jgi:hypothetical protein
MSSTAKIADFDYDATGTTTRVCSVSVPRYSGRNSIIIFVAVYQAYPDTAPTVTGVTYGSTNVGSPVHSMSYSPDNLAMRLYCFGYEPANGEASAVTITATLSGTPTNCVMFVYSLTNSIYIGHQAEDVQATETDLTSSDYTKRAGIAVGCVFAFTATAVASYQGSSIDQSKIMTGAAAGAYHEYVGQTKTVLSGAQTGVDVHHLHIQVSLDTHKEDVSIWM